MTTASPINAMEQASPITVTAQPTTGHDEDPEDDQEPLDALEPEEVTSCPFEARVFERLLQRGTKLLKFSIKDDPEEHVYYLDRQTVETWEGMKIGVADEMEIDMHTITDMFGDTIESVHWSRVNQEIPYIYAPFVVQGSPILSRTKYRLRFLARPGVDLYTQLPRPRNITVGQLKGLVAELMRQMPEYAKQQIAKHQIKMLPGHSDSERISGCNMFDQTIKMWTSDQSINPESPPAKTYIAITAHWRSADHCRRRITYDPGMTLIEASTPLHKVRKILEDAFYRAPKGSGFAVTSFVWRCWSVENGWYVLDEDSTTLGSVEGTVWPMIKYNDREVLLRR
ncbi:hypothetical protein FN846DRAFT_916184 [Sphaerosporella brunnea]|uniref:Uncharacterized protein n=1 Tax=Sphaerosporella brunnea TaxID=1250544 RepID=A0A5J5F8U1_9PEZI|nr:hypothetical protein FN846DRAFT_916184 [Sphaerosporella brunnea]